MVFRSKKCFFRFAVVEIESWILGHRIALANFLGVPLSRIPQNTDQIHDPKQYLISLARRSRKSDIRRDLVPRSNGTASIGPAYNSRLGNFINDKWDPIIAQRESDSLRRAINRFRGIK